MLTPGTRFEEVYAKELELIAARRGDGSVPGDDLAGLALSGGGIRSAAFNLGLLQALGERGTLARCDYLSTVSGGGYIGACLTALCAVDGVDATPDKFPLRDPQVIKYLREHSEYLAPKSGVFRLDTWRLISAYLGGLLLTLLSAGALFGIAAAVWVGVYWPIGASVAGWVGAYLAAYGSTHPRAVVLLAQFWPSIIAAVVWLAGVVLYALASFKAGWTLRYRRWTSRLQGVALAALVFLTVLSALPILFTELELRHSLSRLFAAGSLSALSLTRVFNLGKQVSEVRERVRHGAVAAGSALFVAFVCLLVMYGVWSQREHALAIAAGLLVLVVVLWSVTDINRISMYHFYRDRLNEAFVLRPTPAGLRPNDALRLSQLRRVNGKVPYHLLNATVNLAGSRDPGLRHRKGDFFLFSPLFCGCDATGYRDTAAYERDRVKLASAMAISGAALNPQRGSATNAALAFLMTLLNVRLGVWYRNPKYPPAFVEGSRAMWHWYLLQELLSLANENRRLVSLSDGGHIENLGVYALLKRRCRVIIASDASADPDTTFQDLGRVVRETRIDLGLEIKVDVAPLVPQGADRFGQAHFASGAVYDAAGRSVCQLYYVKPVLTKDDSVDLHEYRRRAVQFPHQSTADQFFDEAQFESYRALGYRSGQDVVNEMTAKGALRVGAAPVA